MPAITSASLRESQPLLAAKAKRGKDAGSPNSRRLFGRLRREESATRPAACRRAVGSAGCQNGCEWRWEALQELPFVEPGDDLLDRLVRVLVLDDRALLLLRRRVQREH